MDTAPYYAPSYFSPDYFYIAPAASTPVTVTGLSPYNAPTYFPPSYFYGGSSATTPVVPVTPVPKGRDHDAYEALLALLRASSVFEDVIFGAATQRSQAGADTYPLAVVTPKGWEESDDYDPVSIVRHVSFTITIVVKSQDGGSQAEQLDWLSSVVERIVNYSDLNGMCLPSLTRIRAGRYEYPTRYPEQSIELDGEFSSIIDPITNLPATS